MTRLDPRWVANALGGTAYGNQVNAPGPGHSDQDRSLSITITDTDPKGYVFYAHAGDDELTCLRYIRDRLMAAGGYNPAPPPQWPHGQPPRQRLERDEAMRQREALRRWEEGLPALGSPVEAYLRGRGLTLTEEVAQVLRYHPEDRWVMATGKVHRIPVMLALFADVISDEPVAIHRTALPSRWCFRSEVTGKWGMLGGGERKKMLGPVSGAVIKLTRCDDSHELLVTEGIENGITWINNTKRKPVWAAGCAGSIKRLPVHPQFRRLTIAADLDKTGVSDAETCRSRWQEADRDVDILVPNQAHFDWNDLIRQ